MPAMLIMGGVNLVAGLSGQKSAKKDRRAALKLQQEALSFNKQRYEDGKSMYGDLEKQLVDGAKEGVKADIAGVTSRAVGDTAQQFAGAEQAMARNQQRYGINPNSGRAEAMARESGVKQALATAGLVNANRENERVRAEDATWSRRRDVAGLGINQMNGAASSVTSGINGMAGTYADSAAQKMASASESFGAAGQMFGAKLEKKFGGTKPDGDAGSAAATPAPVAKPLGGLQAPRPLLSQNQQDEVPAWAVGRENQLLAYR